MPEALRELEREYLAALLAFLESATEQNLERGYGVARRAIANNLGVLDLASMFRKALSEVLPHIPGAPLTEEIVERSMNFFRESLSPFEMTLRGFRENNEKLRESCRQLTNAQTRLRYQNQELSIARQRYSEQFDFAPDGYLVTDLTGKIEEANIAASALLGVEQDELVGDSLSMYLQGDSPASFNAQLLRLQRGVAERLRDWETTIAPETGPSFPAALSAGVIRDPSGKLAGLRWLVRDITQFKRAEAERSELLVRERVARAEAEASQRLVFLAEASKLLAASLDSEAALQNVAQLATPFLADCCVVYILDDKGSLRTVARSPEDRVSVDGSTSMAGCLADWIQRSLSPLNGAPEIRSFLLKTDDERFRIIESLGVRRALASPLVARGKTLGAIALVGADSQRIFGEAERDLLEDLARRCSYAVDNSRLYSEVILQRDKAEKASRVKDEFLAILSHELRNPLVPILGWARIFGTRSDTSDEVFAEGVRSLERNARNIQRLVDDCLELVRTSTRRIRLELQRMDLNSIAAASIEAVVPLAREKGLKLDIDLSDGPLWIIGDRTRLEQVVVNLLTNAVKYTPAGAVEIRARRTQDHAELHVSDTGIGIAPDFIGKVFEPFRQATHAWLTSDSGLGIGLSIAREIIRLHSGWIWAESPGLRRGSTFSIALPLQTTDAALTLPLIDRKAMPALPSAHRCRILLVEDCDDVLYLMKQELEWTGHKVYAAMDGMTALEIAKRELPDIIISDIKMPRLDGYEFIQQVRSLPNLAGTPAIAMTGFGMERDADQARSAGYSAHVVKPVDIAEMERLIQTLTRSAHSA